MLCELETQSENNPCGHLKSHHQPQQQSHDTFILRNSRLLFLELFLFVAFMMIRLIILHYYTIFLWLRSLESFVEIMVRVYTQPNYFHLRFAQLRSCYFHCWKVDTKKNA